MAKMGTMFALKGLIVTDLFEVLRGKKKDI